jgi:hypothetical protein
MQTYIATFHTHFAAQSFARKIKKLGVAGHMMPVPRSLSASCGSCVEFEAEEPVAPLAVEDTEHIYEVCGREYKIVFQEEAE